MIRKFGHLQAPPARVSELFGDLASWPAWMPGVRSLRVAGTSGTATLAEIDQEGLGRRFQARVEVTADQRSLRMRQVAGPFRRWESVWRFLAPPAGEGTTLALESEVELGGVLGLLSPAAVLESTADRFFADVLAGARERLERRPPPGPRLPKDEEVLVRLLRTSRGLEVQVGTRRLLLPVRLS